MKTLLRDNGVVFSDRVADDLRDVSHKNHLTYERNNSPYPRPALPHPPTLYSPRCITADPDALLLSFGRPVRANFRIQVDIDFTLIKYRMFSLFPGQCLAIFPLASPRLLPQSQHNEPPRLTMKIVGYGIKAKVIFDLLSTEAPNHVLSHLK
jgi:hypothetical protein